RPGHEATADQSYGFRYDAPNHLRWVREPRTVDSDGAAIPETEYTLNDYGATVRIRAPLGQVSEMRWATDHLDGSVLDERGNPVRDVVLTWRRDAEGQEQFFEYHDGRGNLTRERTVLTASTKRAITDATGNSVSEVNRMFAFDATFNQRTNLVDAEGNATRHEIDPRTGNLLRTVDAEGLATRFAYYANGDLKERHDPRGFTTQFPRYDLYGNAELVIDPLGNETHSRYDERGRLRETWNTFGHHAEYRYDALDRRVWEARRQDRAPLSGGPDSVQSTTLDAAGLVLSSTHPLGLVTRHFYDALNREVRVEQADVDPGTGVLETYRMTVARDLAGNLITETDARGVTRSHAYDAAGRRIRTSLRGPFGGPGNGDGVIARLAYDRAGNLTNEIDMHGAAIRHVHDALYRVVETHLPVPGAVIRTQYDREGNQRRVTDAAGFPTTLAYDRLYRLVRSVNAEGQAAEYEYDEANNRTLTRDRVTGLETRVRFDAAQREVERTQTGPGLPPAGYSWRTQYRDGVNEVIHENPRGVKTRLRRDGMDRVVEQIVDSEGLALTTRMTYDAAGNVLTVADPQNGDVDVTHTYNRLGQRLRSVFVRTPDDSAEVAMATVYDPTGHPVSTTDRRGIQTRQTYDNLGRLVRSELKEDLSQGGAWLTTRAISFLDSARRMSATDARGTTTHTDSDALGRIVRVENALGQIITHRYGPVDREESTDARGFRTSFEYDRLHRPVRTTEWDATGTAGTTTSVRYEDSARRLVTTDRNGILEIAERDALGRVVRTGKSGPTVAAAFGVDPVVLSTTEYDGNGNVVRVVDGEGRVLEFQHDPVNRITHAVAGAGSAVAGTVRATYDRVGNLLETKDARAHGATFDVRHEYDARYRRVRTVDATGATWVSRYDAGDNQVELIEPRGGSTRFEHDELGALLTVDESARATMGSSVPDAGVTRFRYDAARNRIAQQDASSNLVTYARDVLGRLTNLLQQTLPGTVGTSPRRDLSLGGGVPLSIAYQHDAAGNVTNVVDARGQTVRLIYDHLARLVARHYAAHAERDGAGAPMPFQPLSFAYAYDGNGNLVEAREEKQSPAGGTLLERTALSYDPLNRLRIRQRYDHDDTVGRTLRFDYDLSGNRTNLVDADGHETRYAFDARNRLIAVTLDASSAAPLTATYSWLPDDLPQAVALPGGTVSLRAYDAADRLVALTNAHPAVGAPLSAFTLDYDANGNRVRQTELQPGFSAVTYTNHFQFDALNRLVSSQYGAGGALTNTYAANGNRLTERGVHPASGMVVDRVYHYTQLPSRPATTFSGVNALSRIEDLADPTRSIEYEYDANLNQVARIQGADQHRFRFDARDQMIEAQVAGTFTRFDYTHERLRAKKLGAAGSETRYLHDQAAVVQEYGAVATGHATQHKYEYGLGLLSFGTPTGLGLAREFYLRDPLGSVVHLVDAAGTALAGYQYDAWGGVRRQHGASANPRQFTGHYRDVETGLQYFGARYYDDEQARFVSQDPNLGESATPPSLHRYLYAHGNPLRFTDPTGFAAETAQEADQWLSEAKRDLKSITDRFEADIEAQGADAVAKYRAGPAAEAKLQQLGEEHRRLLQEAGLTDADLTNPVMADRAKWGVALFKRDLDRWVSAEGAGAWRAYAATVAAVAAEAVVSPLELGAAAGTVAGKLDVGAEITAGEWVAAAGDVMAGVQGLGTVGKIGASALSRRAAQSSAAQLARGGVIKEARR
ncbi:MAG: hypothetical protein IT580_15930, partial [Verrucomicrobiales bacterium]|nr:hypothetical protein [Verrucomicrobiales bacterium]